MQISHPPLALFFTIILLISENLFAQEELISVHPFVLTGVVKNSNGAVLLEKFGDYLNLHSGYPLKITFVTNYSDLSQKLRNDALAPGWTCGAPYVQDHKLDNQQLVAVPTFNQKTTHHSVVLTRNKRPEKTLADFKGGILAYSDPRSKSVIKKLSTALVNMNNDTSSKLILEPFGLDEFIIKNNSFYKPIERILSEVKIITGK